MSAITLTRTGEQAAPAISEAQRNWRTAGIALLSIRFIQGFIYWGGGSRRFIYAPSKLDAWGGHNWMANQFQTAIPGALFGTDHLIHSGIALGAVDRYSEARQIIIRNRTRRAIVW